MSTARSSISQLCPKSRTSTLDHGQRTKARLTNFVCTTIQPMKQRNSGQTGSPKQSNTFCKSTLQGRGANLRAVTKPLLPLGPTRTWRKGRPAYWEQLRARFQLAIKQLAEVQHGPVRGFMMMVKDVQKHWQGPPTWGQFLDTTYHWHKYRDPHAADLMEQTMTHQHKEAQQQANDESMLQYQGMAPHRPTERPQRPFSRTQDK